MEQDNRTDTAAYGDLLFLMEDARKQIAYYKNTYTAEVAGIEKRRYSLKTTFTYNLGFLVLLVLLEIFLIVSISDVNVILFVAMGIIIVLLLIGFIYLLRKVIKAFIIYRINTVPGVMPAYIKKHNIHTMVEEQEYCGKVLKRLLEYEAVLARIEKDMKSADIDPESALDEVTRMDFDIPDFKYTGGRSIK